MAIPIKRPKGLILISPSMERRRRQAPRHHDRFAGAKRLSARLQVSGARIGHGSDVVVLENRPTAFPAPMQSGIHHGTRQIVGRDHQVGEQDPKHGIDRPQ